MRAPFTPRQPLRLCYEGTVLVWGSNASAASQVHSGSSCYFIICFFFCLMQMHGTVLQICIRSSFCWCFCCLVRSACLLCWTLEVQCKCISRPHSKTSSSCSHFVRALKMCRISLGRCSVSWTTIWWLICWVFRLTDQACSVSFGSVHWLDFLFCAWRVPRANDIAVR